MPTSGRERRINVPVALVHGFLGPNSSTTRTVGDTQWHPYWGSAFEAAMPDQKLIVLTPSGVASLYDRAVQMFYQLKGGKVDYGAEHSTCFGHSRFGRTISEPKYPEWDSEHPVHLVGHSFGGPTVRMLQHLLTQANIFPGYTTSADWVLSITTISAPNNGALAVYALGASTEHTPLVHKLSAGYALGSLVILAEWLDIGAFRRYVFDFQMEHWNYSWKTHGWGGLQRLVTGLFTKNDLFEAEDNAAFDMTVHSMSQWNSVFKTNEVGTYYLNVMAFRDIKDLPNSVDASSSFEGIRKLSSWPSGWDTTLTSSSSSSSSSSSASNVSSLTGISSVSSCSFNGDTSNDDSVFISASSTATLAEARTIITPTVQSRGPFDIIGTMIDIFLWFVMYVRMALYAFLGLQIRATSFELLKPTNCFSEPIYKSAGVGDGLISSFEQRHPCVPIEHEAPHIDLPLGVLLPMLRDDDDQVFKGEHVARPGVWFNTHVVADHCGVVPFPVDRTAQFDFFVRLFEYLSVLQPVSCR